MFTEFYFFGPFMYLITVSGVLEQMFCSKFTVKNVYK